MERTPRKSGRAMKYGAIALVVVLVFVALAVLHTWEKKNGRYSAEQQEASFTEYWGERYVPREDVDTLLVIGLTDDGGQSVNELALVIFDNDAKTTSAVRLDPRTVTPKGVVLGDVYTQTDGEKAGCQSVADAVSDLLSGVKINRYVALTEQAKATVVEFLDGGEITAEKKTDLIRDVISDASVLRLQGLARQLMTYEHKGEWNIAGDTTTAEGATVFVPDADAVHALVFTHFYECQSH